MLSVIRFRISFMCYFFSRFYQHIIIVVNVIELMVYGSLNLNTEYFHRNDAEPSNDG